MNFTIPPVTLGWIIALVVLIVAIVLLVSHSFTWPLALIAALAVARLT